MAIILWGIKTDGHGCCCAALIRFCRRLRIKAAELLLSEACVK